MEGVSICKSNKLGANGPFTRPPPCSVPAPRRNRLYIHSQTERTNCTPRIRFVIQKYPFAFYFYTVFPYYFWRDAFVNGQSSHRLAAWALNIQSPETQASNWGRCALVALRNTADALYEMFGIGFLSAFPFAHIVVCSCAGVVRPYCQWYVLEPSEQLPPTLRS